MTVSLFSPGDTAVLLIDHQVGTMSWVRSTDFEEVKANALALAKSAKALDMPLVLTTSLEDHAQGPLQKEFVEIAPAEYAARIRRVGVVNAMDDPNFAAAGGSMSKLAAEAALRRMEAAGAGITSTNMILTELARHWASPAGEKLIPIVGEPIPA